MTASGQRGLLPAENVAAAPEPSHGQRPAAKITARTPLPKGWASFCSKPDERHPSHWYASPPYSVDQMIRQYGELAYPLQRTVTAETWHALHAAVADQMRVYEEITSNSAEG
jgi:hypothetical protein